jgi:3-carboxy-cis,cis-muconate cycloisomerase
VGHWLARLCGVLGKMAVDVAHLASTEVGEVAEPAAPGRGGSSSMPHKRNPVAATAILANAQAASGHAASLTMSMLAAHERPAGAWQAEFHSLATLFGLAAGACAQGRVLATGLTVDTAAMARNLDLTRGLVYADAAAAALAPSLGRAAALDAVTQAADRVRRDGVTLAQALAAAGPDIRYVFDPGPAVAAAAARTARAVARVRKTAATLSSLA